MTNDPKDEMLWRIAKRRVAFKQTFVAYLLVNMFLIAVWYFSSGTESYFWPKWPLLGWGLGLTIQYFDAYHGNSLFSPEDEYQKLKKKDSSNQ